MLRSIKNHLPWSKKESLPIGSYRAPSASHSWGPRKNSFQDGSAASIHTTPTLQQAWQRASPTVKATWISLLACICMTWFGWRWIRYNSAGLYLNCHSTACELKVIPIGWKKKVVIEDLSRSQLQNAFAVKTTKLGAFVTDQNIQLTEPYDRSKKKSKYNKSKNSNYKGPDENGNFLSYAIVLSDKKADDSNQRRRQQKEKGLAEEERGQEAQQPEVDLRLLHPYMDPMEASSSDETANAAESAGRLFRLIPRQFGVRQSKRRVRTMIQKIESYIKRRRQKLVVRENSPPSWQGVLLMVFGCIGIVLSAVLGQFQDEAAVRGPGVRRQQQNANKRPPHTVADSYASTVPSSYEVSTKPAPQPQVQKAGYRRNTTQARKRTGN